MTDAEKEMFIEIKKRQFHNMYTPDIADELCRKLDEAKKGADTLVQLYNTLQQSTVISLPLSPLKYNTYGY